MKKTIIIFDNLDDQLDQALFDSIIQKYPNASIQSIEKSCETCNTECCGGLKRACSRWSHYIK